MSGGFAGTWLPVILASDRDNNVAPAPPAARLLWTVADVGHREGFSADGLSLYTLKNEKGTPLLMMWDLRTGTRVRSHQLPTANYEPGEIELPRTLTAGRYFVCEAKGKTLTIDLKTGREQRIDMAENADARHFRMSPDGAHFARFNGYSQSMLVETKSGKVVHQIGEKDADDKFTVYGKVDGHLFTADGKYYCYWGREESGSVLRVWDIAARKVATMFPNLRGSPVASGDGKTLIVPEGPPATSAKNRDKMYTEGGPGRLVIWDLQRQKERGTIPRKNVLESRSRFDLCFSPDQRILAVWDKEPGWDKTLRFWDVASGRPVATIELSAQPLEGCFSPDGNRFAVMSRDRPTLHMIDVVGNRVSWQAERELHWSAGLHFCFTSDSKQLFAATPTALKHLNVVDGGVKHSLAIGSLGSGAQLTPDGRHIAILDCNPAGPNRATPDDDEELVHFWRVIERDTGREVFRTEETTWSDFHFPGNGKTMIQCWLRKDCLGHDLKCWEIPAR